MAPPWLLERKQGPLRRHRRHDLPDLNPYEAPQAPTRIEFDARELAISIGRNLAHSSAPFQLIGLLIDQAERLIRGIVDNEGSDFALEPDVAHLSDAATNHLAHDIGVGASGIYGTPRIFLARQCKGDNAFGREDTGLCVGNWGARPFRRFIGIERWGSPEYRAWICKSESTKGVRRSGCPWLGDQLATGEQIVSGYGIGIVTGGGGHAGLAVRAEPDFTASVSRGKKDAEFISDTIFRSHISSIASMIGSRPLQVIAQNPKALNSEISLPFRVVEVEGRSVLFATEEDQDPMRWWISRFGLDFSIANSILKEIFTPREAPLRQAPALFSEPVYGEQLFVARDGSP